MVKTLTITEEAYERLAAKKEPGESFTDVILKMTGRASLMDLVGVLSHKEAEDLRSHIKDRRKSMRVGVDNTSRRLR